MNTVALFTILVAVPLSACSSTPQSTAPFLGTAPPSAITSPFHFKNQGVYESCPLTRATVCLDRLQRIAQAGFTMVLNYDQLEGSVQQELTYARKAAALGIKIIWNIDYPVLRDQGDVLHVFPDLAASCRCSNAARFVSYVIDLVKDHPATWGYYIGDEVPIREQTKLKVFANGIKALDPSHPRLIVQGSESANNAKANLAPFADIADVLAVDFYPVGARDESISETRAVAHIVQSLAEQNGKQSAMVLQAFSLSEYHGQSCSPLPACTTYPTTNEMRQMLASVLRNSHPAFILWYSYFDILRSDNVSKHWEDLIQAAKG